MEKSERKVLKEINVGGLADGSLQGFQSLYAEDEAMNYLKYLTEVIHTVVVATTDEVGLPVTCAIDMMDADESGLYFLTAKGKGFYNRLKKNGYMALTGILALWQL